MTVAEIIISPRGAGKKPAPASNGCPNGHAQRRRIRVYARPKAFGGVLHLPDALRLYPHLGVVLYNRTSSHSQAGGAERTKLQAKTDAALAAVLRYCREARQDNPDRVPRPVHIVQGVEVGKLSKPRNHLDAAAWHAHFHKSLLVAADLSRFIRAEAYDRRTNRTALPTPEEFQRLRDLTRGVPLATVERPDLTEDERHSKATRRTGRAGRPRRLDDDLLADIFDCLGCLFTPGKQPEVERWQTPVRDVIQVFKAFGLTASAICRASRRLSPCGKTWRELAIAKAVALGLYELDEDLPGTLIIRTGYGSGAWVANPPPLWDKLDYYARKYNGAGAGSPRRPARPLPPP
jgi:hypothetical protein